MGYSIPAAMGARLAAKERQVVAVCGDGSFQMSMMELATIRQFSVPVKIIVLKNNYLGMVREYQHYTYKDHYSVVDLSGSPDLCQAVQGIRHADFTRPEPIWRMRKRHWMNFLKRRMKSALLGMSD